MAYTGYDEKTKARNKKYMDKLARVTLWLYPEEKKNVEANAHRAGKSINQYIKDAIAEYEDDLYCLQLAEEAEKENDGSFITIEDLAKELNIDLQDNH